MDGPTLTIILLDGSDPSVEFLRQVCRYTQNEAAYERNGMDGDDGPTLAVLGILKQS